MSRWDGRLLWKYYDNREFVIECEPYFDMNFEDMLYLTDTGRRWNGGKYSISDKAAGSSFAKASEDRRLNGRVVSVRDKAEGERLRAEGRSRQSAVGSRQYKERRSDSDFAQRAT